MGSELEGQIRASQAGDKAAFGGLVSRYQGLVCSVTYSITWSSVAVEGAVARWRVVLNSPPGTPITHLRPNRSSTAGTFAHWLGVGFSCIDAILA